ncbi:hypothetical protein GOP47_0003017 [Adiantum capillus-veneris]|uniref:Uncharacterized protein n=1 Tax=Adiantum capillus-veneris TaxID=13818 RepID=A0A9D4ZPP9_ADICA|nr:hypothetical protein GOP47_0003017 [Adiantum capillus-veneris]
MCNLYLVCPSARLVSVSSSRGVTDLSICQLAKSCPQLEHLDVYWQLQSFEKKSATVRILQNIFASKCRRRSSSDLYVDDKLEAPGAKAYKALGPRRAKEEARARLPNEKLRDDKTPAQRNVNVDRYGHWQLYNERFQSGFFQF